MIAGARPSSPATATTRIRSRGHRAGRERGARCCLPPRAVEPHADGGIRRRHADGGVSQRLSRGGGAPRSAIDPRVAWLTAAGCSATRQHRGGVRGRGGGRRQPPRAGSDADANAAILDARGFHRLFSRHTVLAVRSRARPAGVVRPARAAASPRPPGPSIPSFDFGRDDGLLRGFDPRASSVSMRRCSTPISAARSAGPGGPGLWPIFRPVDHAAAFADLGHAWDTTFRAADVRRSAGGELATDLVLIHYLPITIAGGARGRTIRRRTRSRRGFRARRAGVLTCTGSVIPWQNSRA